VRCRAADIVDIGFDLHIFILIEGEDSVRSAMLPLRGSIFTRHDALVFDGGDLCSVDELALLNIRSEVLVHELFVLAVAVGVAKRRGDIPVSSALAHEGSAVLLHLANGALLDGAIVKSGRIRRTILHAYLLRTVAPHHDIDRVFGFPCLLHDRQPRKLGGEIM
jgi:hypothetical protein